MSLVTRCPECRTAFRVIPAQLSARAGQVRCGKCSTIFDGIAGLVAAAPAASRPATAAALQSGEQEPVPSFMAEPRPPRRALWWTLSLFALLVLASQLVHYFRAEIAAAVPQSRPYLEAACRAIGCDIRLPRVVQLLGIDSYEVHADPQREGVIVLNAVIRNRAPFAQEYPALRFTLTDELNRKLVSRAVYPREYLNATRAGELIARGIEANSETSLSVYFDANPMRASGYELALFYPS